MFIDTHAHINNERFAGKIEETIKRAKDSGVEKIICSANDIKTAYEVVNLADKFDDVFATIGVHPQDAYDFDKIDIEILRELAANKKVVGIGEIGLEYREGCPDKVVQKHAFCEQIILANELNKPIVIHSRDACADTLEILKEFAPLKGTFHCFSESLEVAHIVQEMGLHISVGGVVTFKNGRKLQEVVSNIPLEKLLLETDCPYLAPEPHRGSLNQPAYIPLIAEKVALLKGLSVGEVAKVTTDNAWRLFEL